MSENDEQIIWLVLGVLCIIYLVFSTTREIYKSHREFHVDKIPLRELGYETVLNYLEDEDPAYRRAVIDRGWMTRSELVGMAQKRLDLLNAITETRRKEGWRSYKFFVEGYGESSYDGPNEEIARARLIDNLPNVVKFANPKIECLGSEEAEYRICRVRWWQVWRPSIDCFLKK